MATEALEELAASVVAACLRGGFTVATAESCTGGLVADAITDVPGSSGCFRGGVVAYSDTLKATLLRVPEETLSSHGAVSAQVARAMAFGARERLGVELAVAITGIAGPGGGSSSKPVGLTYVAVAGPAGIEVEKHVWSGDRLANKSASADAALRLLLSALESAAGTTGAPSDPRGVRADPREVGE